MAWEVRMIEEAKQNFSKLGNDIRRQVLAGIRKVSKAPLPRPDGYGKPLGNKQGNNLTGFFKIKYAGIGIRVVYTLAMKDQVMNIIVISQRDDNACYELAARIYKKYGSEIFNDIFQHF